MIYTVVSRFEMVKLKNLIHRIDPAAFISVQQANELLIIEFEIERHWAG